MIETIKELINEPEKTKRYFLFFVNSLLAIIITSKLYENWFGKYELILFQSATFWEDVYQFLITGRFIIVLFLFVFVKKASDFLLESLLLGMDTIIIWRVEKKSVNLIDKKEIPDILSFFSVVRFDKESKKVLPGKNFDYFYNFLSGYDKEILLTEIQNIKHSLLSEIYKTFLLFAIVYFMFTNINRPILITKVIIILIILGAILILILQYYKEIIKLHYDNIWLGVKMIKQIDVTDDFIRENKFVVKSSIDNPPIMNLKMIEFNDRLYQIHHFTRLNGFLLGNLKSIDENQNKDRISMVVIHSIEIPLAIMDEFTKRKFVTLIEFNKEENLLKELKDCFGFEKGKVD
ncbi:hypothetical protein [Flavobacterium sp. U410]